MPEGKRSTTSRPRSRRSLEMKPGESSPEKPPGKRGSISLFTEFEQKAKQQKIDIPSETSGNEQIDRTGRTHHKLDTETTENISADETGITSKLDALYIETENLQKTKDIINKAYNKTATESSVNSEKFYLNTPVASEKIDFVIDPLYKPETEEQTNLTESTPNEHTIAASTPGKPKIEYPSSPKGSRETKIAREALEKLIAERQTNLTESTGHIEHTFAASTPGKRMGEDLFDQGRNKKRILDAKQMPPSADHSSPTDGRYLVVTRSSNDQVPDNSPDGLRRQLAAWETKLWDNQDDSVEAIATLDKSHKLASQNIEQRLLDKIDSGKIKLSTAPGDRTALTTTHGEIEFAEKLKIDLEDHLAALRKAKKSIGTVQETLLTIDAKMKDYDKLRSKIAKISDFPLEDFSSQYKMKLQISRSNDIYLKNTPEYINEIDISIYDTSKALQNVMQEITELHEYLEQQKQFKSHSFFSKGDMRRARAETKMVPRGTLPGDGGLTAIRILLNEQGIEVTNNEAHIAQTLDADWFGNIDLTSLETNLPTLKDQRGLQFGKIEQKDLKTALSKGPIGALLETPGSRPVIAVLDRIEWNPRARQPDVVVLDPFVPGPYKISAEKFTRAWKKKGVILPKDAFQHNAGPVVRPPNTIFTTISKIFDALPWRRG